MTQQRLAVAEGEALKDYVQVRTYDAACRIVAVNLALAIVPKEPCLPLVKGLRLRAIPLSDEWALRRFVVCVRDRSELNAPCRMLLEALESEWYESGAPSG